MAEEIRERHNKWIIDSLAPNLIENQKLFSCKNTNEHIKIKSIEIKEMSLAVAFMLTNCYFVKISLLTKAEHSQCADKNEDGEKTFDIVVKVWRFIQLQLQFSTKQSNTNQSDFIVEQKNARRFCM